MRGQKLNQLIERGWSFSRKAQVFGVRRLDAAFLLGRALPTSDKSAVKPAHSKIIPWRRVDDLTLRDQGASPQHPTPFDSSKVDFIPAAKFAQL
jgi:hypothetical protein